MQNLWAAVSAVAASLAAFFAAFAAWQSKRQADETRKTALITADMLQVQVFEDLFRDIREQERHFYSSETKDPEAKALRDRMFFNTVNHLAFLVETQVISKPDFVKFYSSAFRHWWTMFQQEVTKEELGNPELYEEFKRLILNLRIIEGEENHPPQLPPS